MVRRQGLTPRTPRQGEVCYLLHQRHINAILHDTALYRISTTHYRTFNTVAGTVVSALSSPTLGLQVVRNKGHSTQCLTSPCLPVQSTLISRSGDRNRTCDGMSTEMVNSHSQLASSCLTGMRRLLPYSSHRRIQLYQARKRLSSPSAICASIAFA